MNSVTATAHPCNCGCSKCKQECCELECLVQPRFFCGQLLSDQDLTAMLDWVKGKSALIRYRHGWGVVCGLQLSCASKPDSGGVIGVSRGYAIDCCGNDIIVCCDTTLDLSTCCAPPPAPCGGNHQGQQQQAGNNNQQYFGPFSLPSAEVQAVDVLIRYKETQSDPKSGLARGGCNGTLACEYTRTHEDYELYCEPVDDCEDPSDKRAIRWFHDYEEGLAKVFEQLEKLHDPGDPQRSITRLLEWLRKHPPQAFCFIGEYVCDLQRLNPLPEDWFKQVVFWIVQDWRISYFRCACEGCGPDTAVRLARVWLWCRKDSQGRQVLKVIYINSYPPFRRPVARDCWPAPADSISLAFLIWQTADSSRSQLCQLGFSDVQFSPLEYKDLGELGGKLRRESILVSCADRAKGARMVAWCREDHCKQSRIVYFSITDGETPKKPAEDPEKLPDDAPELGLRQLYGIGDGIAKRLQAAGIKNIRDLSNATPQAVKEALSTMPIQPPDEARSTVFIEDAKAALESLKKGG
jgi:predicted flap endonuclease-1-like 5' DNA nuclease